MAYARLGLTGGRVIKEAVRRREGYIDRNGRNREIFMISYFLAASESELHLDRWPFPASLITALVHQSVRSVFSH